MAPCHTDAQNDAMAYNLTEVVAASFASAGTASN
jgi:hypothetical protein